MVSDITHVELAFMPSSTFNEMQPSEWPLFTTVEAVRSQFAPGTAIMVAIGGWGDTEGFSTAAATDSSRKLFARNVKTMVDYTGADGEFKASDAFIPQNLTETRC
jgi:GH18 family chitinase